MTETKLYKGWEVSKLRQGAYKATKAGHSINSCSLHLIKCLIDENENK